MTSVTITTMTMAGTGPRTISSFEVPDPMRMRQSSRTTPSGHESIRQPRKLLTAPAGAPRGPASSHLVSRTASSPSTGPRIPRKEGSFGTTLTVRRKFTATQGKVARTRARRGSAVIALSELLSPFHITFQPDPDSIQSLPKGIGRRAGRGKTQRLLSAAFTSSGPFLFAIPPTGRKSETSLTRCTLGIRSITLLSPSSTRRRRSPPMRRGTLSEHTPTQRGSSLASQGIR
uniref:Uncharacterized protein n=1 Tax=Hubei sobemo-like virus 4 TaxID=1923227 RepID=A0A1L3KEU5_9VIRU|nr:hypothetical protein 2 [Hubei sobemo-like virus 4]